MISKGCLVRLHDPAQEVFTDIGEEIFLVISKPYKLHPDPSFRVNILTRGGTDVVYTRDLRVISET